MSSQHVGHNTGVDYTQPAVGSGTPTSVSSSRYASKPLDTASNSVAMTPKSPKSKAFEPRRLDSQSDGSTIKPRPSRWADEVDEEDNFMVSEQGVVRGTRESQKDKMEQAPMVQHPRPTVAPKPLDKLVPGKGRDERVPPAHRASKESKKEPTHAPRAVSTQASSSKPARADLEEIVNMKEIMAKKAEERKRQKEAEEARLEAERKARCEAKLREIEARQRSRTASVVVDEPKVQNPTRSPKRVMKPAISGASQSSHVQDDDKEQAFNASRRDLRERRDKDRKVIEPLESSSPVPAAQLSPHAKEFVPGSTMPVPPVQHWPQFPHQHHMGAPHVQQPLHHMHHVSGVPGGHQMHHPSMMGIMAGPGGQPTVPQQVPPGQMYGYGQYPPFPYGYPQAHQMGNHFY